MSGLLNKAITTGAMQLIGTIPGGIQYAAVNVVVSSPLGVSAEAQLFISTGVAGPIDAVGGKATIPSMGEYIRDGEIASPGENIYIQATAGLIVRATFISEN